MNSSPTKFLQNTCAGIIGRRAFKTPVRVLATIPGHLELVFGGANDQNTQNSKLVLNEKYGKLLDSDEDNEENEPEFNAPNSLRKRLLLRTRSEGSLRERSGAVEPLHPYL
ncbi:hypothetical protein MMC22_003135 [Lobaria immixta]|nr:hypothetical protein [Lobaria immixta]